MAESRRVDTRGLKCPVPVVRMNGEVRDVPAGEDLHVIADDPAFPPDVKAWCRRTGHELVSLETIDGVTEAVVRIVR